MWWFSAVEIAVWACSFLDVGASLVVSGIHLVTFPYITVAILILMGGISSWRAGSIFDPFMWPVHLVRPKHHSRLGLGEYQTESYGFFCISALIRVACCTCFSVLFLDVLYVWNAECFQNHVWYELNKTDFQSDVDMCQNSTDLQGHAVCQSLLPFDQRCNNQRRWSTLLRLQARESANLSCDANQEQESLSYFLEMMDADDLHNEYCETMNGTQLNCVKAYAIGEGGRGILWIENQMNLTELCPFWPSKEYTYYCHKIIIGGSHCSQPWTTHWTSTWSAAMMNTCNNEECIDSLPQWLREILDRNETLRYCGCKNCRSWWSTNSCMMDAVDVAYRRRANLDVLDNTTLYSLDLYLKDPTYAIQLFVAFLMALGPLLWLISLALFACLLGNPLATPTNLELQQKVQEEEISIAEELRSTGTLVQRIPFKCFAGSRVERNLNRLVMLFELGFYFADVVLDIEMILLYMRKHHYWFSTIQGCIFLRSIIDLVFRHFVFGPSVFREIWDSFKTNLRTDVFLSILQIEKTGEATLSLLLQTYALFYMGAELTAYWTALFSLLISARGIAQGCYIHFDLAIIPGEVPQRSVSSSAVVPVGLPILPEPSGQSPSPGDVGQPLPADEPPLMGSDIREMVSSKHAEAGLSVFGNVEEPEAVKAPEEELGNENLQPATNCGSEAPAVIGKGVSIIAFAWVRPAVLYDATTATAAVAAFPAGLPEVPTFAAWMLRVDVLGNAMADVMYILVAMVINPTVQDWKGIDEDLNYWQLESLYQHTSFTRGESRRDFGVKKGFDVVGGLKHCAAQPSNRLRGMESWVSLTFQVAVPVGLQSWRQEDAPAKLRISLPNGFLLPVDASTCSDVLQRSADPETPQLRTVQFPRVYGPLPSLEGLVCTLTEKVLTVEFLPHIALLPSTVYAFRLRVISPTLDQVRGRFWSLQTLNFNDVEKESCTIDLWDSSGLLPDIPVPEVSAMPTLTVAYVLPLIRLPNASKVATLVIQASEGFAFPRSCAKEEVVECIGDRSVARLTVPLDQVEQVTLQVRLPSWKANEGPWSLLFYGETQEELHTLPSPLIQTPSVLVEPADLNTFRAEAVVQASVLTFTTSKVLPRGGVIELSLPGAAFEFLPEHPCSSIGETFAGELQFQSRASLGVTETKTSSCAGGITCSKPALFSCQVISSTLRIQVAEELALGTYCIDFEGVVPDGRTVPDFPLLFVTKDLDGSILEMAPLLGQRIAESSDGMAPVVQRSAHLSLCYPSRLPSNEATEMVLRLAFSSLLLSSNELTLSARLCFAGLELLPLEDGTVSCTVFCAVSSGCGSCITMQGTTDVFLPFQQVVISLPAMLAATALPRVDLELLGELGGTSLILQAASYKSSLPILPLLQLQIEAETPTLDGFQAQLFLELPNVSGSLMLDVSLPVGLFVDTCGPVACAKAAQSDASPEPVFRFVGMQGVSVLNMELYASRPLRVEQNFWRVILREENLQAVAAVTLPGFSVAYPASFGVAVSNQRAGSLFSKIILTFVLTSPLPSSSLLYVRLPKHGATEPQEVEPDRLFQVAEATNSTLGGFNENTVLFTTLQPLSTGILYAISFPMVNPILSPDPNLFILQSYLPNVPEIHSLGTSDGEFQVFGEFESFQLFSMSTLPALLTPSMVQFKLRTPLPPSTNAVHPVQLRLVSEMGSFDHKNCLVDVLKPGTSLPRISSVLVTPDDCLVSADGASANFMFGQILLAKTNYYLWIYTINPSDPTSRIYAASTIVNGHRVHETSFRFSWSNLQAVLQPGSYAAGSNHRAVLKIYSAKTLQGQRGSIQLQLPSQFLASCDQFRPGGNLPPTARCRTLRETDTSGAVLQIYWRSLFGQSALQAPLELAFMMTNANTTLVEGDWTVTMFEGENQNFAVDFSGSDGLESFEVCQAFGNLSIRREDASVISLVMKTGVDVAAAFDLLFRVELRSSLSAPAELYCPETSIWQPRDELLGHLVSSAQGLPRYTVCAQEPRVVLPDDNFRSVSQHVSAVLFHLPYSRFYGRAEAHAIEVRMQRSELAFVPVEPLPSEASVELLNVNLEAEGQRIACGSLPLGPVATPITPSQNTTEGSDEAQIRLKPGSPPVSAGRSRVLLGKDRSGQEVAVKAISLRAAQRAGIDERCLWGEVQAMREVQHPNLPRLLDAMVSWESLPLVPEEAPFLCIVMEYLAAESLSNRIRQCLRLPLQLVERVLLQLSSALARLHRSDIVHRDVWVGNILIDKQTDKITLMDLGCAERLHKPTLNKKLNIPYMSPEAAAGRPHDVSDDSWAVGLLLTEMITGCFVVDRLGRVDVPIHNHPPVLHQALTDAVGSSTSPLLGRLTTQCLEMSAPRRPKMAEVVNCLRPGHRKDAERMGHVQVNDKVTKTRSSPVAAVQQRPRSPLGFRGRLCTSLKVREVDVSPGRLAGRPSRSASAKSPARPPGAERGSEGEGPRVEPATFQQGQMVLYCAAQEAGVQRATIVGVDGKGWLIQLENGSCRVVEHSEEWRLCDLCGMERPPAPKNAAAPEMKGPVLAWAEAPSAPLGGPAPSRSKVLSTSSTVSSLATAERTCSTATTEVSIDVPGLCSYATVAVPAVSPPYTVWTSPSPLRPAMRALGVSKSRSEAQLGPMLTRPSLLSFLT
eukprot:symbB.v1.2.013671.t2/scaffold949.1/size149710/2